MDQYTEKIIVVKVYKDGRWKFVNQINASIRVF